MWWNEQKAPRLELLLHLEVVCSTTAKMHLWRSLKKTQLVSFVTFFSHQYIDMTKFGYLYICQVDVVQGGFSCVRHRTWPIFGHDNWCVCVSLKTPPICTRSFFKEEGPLRGSAQGGIRVLHHLRRASERWFKSDHLENKPQRALSRLLRFW